MTAPRHFALWLIPESRTLDLLAGVIDTLGELYNGPRFAPHVTLLGRFNGEASRLIAQLRTLGRNARALDLEISGWGASDDYFRCLYLKLAPTAPLEELRRRCASLAGVAPETPYHPHISLFYGRLPEADKQEIRQSQGHRIPGRVRLTGMQLVALDHAVEDWHVCAHVTLGADRTRSA